MLVLRFTYQIFISISGNSRCIGDILGQWFPTWGKRTPIHTRAFRGTQKQLNNGGKIPLLGYLFTVTTYTFEITAIILFTKMLLIWSARFMVVGCEGERKRKTFGNHCSRRYVSLHQRIPNFELINLFGHEYYVNGAYAKVTVFNFLQPVLTTWRKDVLLQWEADCFNIFGNWS
jgi:hypothetical protein